MTTALIVLAIGTGADAQTKNDRAVPDLAQTSPAPANEQRTFDIPPQPLVTALNAFGRQAGVQISVDESIARGVQARGVSGTMSAEQALNALLAGTGIVGRFTGPRAVMLTRPQSGQLAPGVMQLDPVQVQGAFPVPSQAMIGNIQSSYAGGQVATGGQLGLLGNRPVMDTPFNQTSYTTKKAQDQQAKTVQEVLVDDPSVRSLRAPGSIGADQVTIRGFGVYSTSWAYGGLFGILPVVSPMVELAERVEILKGPSAMLNGMPPAGAIGGTVNVVPKRAPDEPLTQGTAGYISSGQVGGHIDFARRFGPDKEVGVRFNGVARAGHTDLQYNTDQRELALLGLDYRGSGFRLSADLGYQYQYAGGLPPYLSLAAGVQLPWAPNARNNPAAQPWSFQSRKDAFGVVNAEVDLAPDVTAFASFGAHDNRIGGVYSPFTTITAFSGAASAQAPFNISTWTTYLTGQGGVRANFTTGPVSHEAAIIGTVYSQTDGAATNTGSQAAFATNIYDATVVGVPSIVTPASNKTSFSGLNSVAIADTLTAANKRIQLTLGGRLQQVSGVNYNASGMTTSSYNESAFSPSVSLVVKPWENVSIYGNCAYSAEVGRAFRVKSAP